MLPVQSKIRIFSVEGTVCYNPRKAQYAVCSWAWCYSPVAMLTSFLTLTDLMLCCFAAMYAVYAMGMEAAEAAAKPVRAHEAIQTSLKCLRDYSL